MTNEETIKVISRQLKICQKNVENFEKTFKGEKSSYRYDVEVYNLVLISALEKQIPKKPIKSDRKIRYCEVWKCPNCGFEWSGRVVDYCYKCGQAIDWSDTE